VGWWLLLGRRGGGGGWLVGPRLRFFDSKVGMA
jgi:hypothetical protein